MALLASSYLLYGACAVGAVGVALALPRKGISPQVIGALIAAVALGLLALALAGPLEFLPNPFFFIFSAVGLGAALRVISHPRPVYAALYFILTILASCGLYLLLSAEFMAFSLLIVYAGAILITYLFVLMLATQAPSADDPEAAAGYDRFSREPALAAGMGFVLLAALSQMLMTGSNELTPAGDDTPGRTLIAEMPGKVERELRRSGALEDGEQLARDEDGNFMLDTEGVTKEYGEGRRTVVPADEWPEALQAPTNIERVGFDLLVAKPGAIEIAGVILLMAMLGAVVLSRKRVELDESLVDENRHLEADA